MVDWMAGYLVEKRVVWMALIRAECLDYCWEETMAVPMVSALAAWMACSMAVK